VKEVFELNDLAPPAKGLTSQKPPVRLGVLGDPIAHSLSPQMQNAALKAAGIEARYARFQIPPADLKDALEAVRRLEFIGVNLTVPHKVAAFSLVDEVDRDAKAIAAINTIAVRNNRLVGFNTDASGFGRALRSEFSVDLRDLRVLLLGAGGAARAIAVQCARAQCERLAVVARDSKKAGELLDLVREAFTGPRVLGPAARLEAVPWTEGALRTQIEHTDLVVNATPLGLGANDPDVLRGSLLQPHLMVFDTVYGTRPTPLVRNAREAGARAVDGLPMLLHQGAAAFELWFSREAPIAEMKKALLGP
jgi:shikimate dehydrogenase